MNDFPDELLERIVKDNPPLSDGDQALQKGLAAYFDGKRNKVFALMMLWVLLGITAILVGMQLLILSSSTKYLLWGTVALLGGMEMTLLIKIWFWIVDSKLSMMKHIVNMQIFMGKLDPERSEEERVEPYQALMQHAPDFWERLDLVRFRNWSGWAIVVAAMIQGGIIGVIMSGASLGLPFMTPYANQVDTWHLKASGDIEATSTLDLKNLSKREPLRLQLPYENATVVSIGEFVGSELAYRELGSGAIEVAPGPWMEKNHWIIVRWTFRIEELDPGYNTQLRSLLPAKQYHLSIARDSDAPWVFHDDPTKVHSLQFTRNGSKAMDFGSCGFGLVKR